MIKDALHLKAPGNWMNDPNGFIYYKGRYHLFYQYFPYAPQWGTMHWGHAVSEDLIHWEHVGTALFPTKYEDQNGCFSGSALELDGKLHLYYTGVHYSNADPENIHSSLNNEFASTQMMIASEDGMTFDNFNDKKIIVPVIENEELGDSNDTRDPKVWREGKKFYMALGSTYKKQIGRVIFYESDDALHWKYASQFRSERFGKILECPDVFKVKNEYVFIGSPMYIAEDAGGYEHHAVCMPAQFKADTCELKLPEYYQYIDYGLDLYAPQTNVDKDGRRVMIAWMRMPKTVEETGRKPWNGMMCLPRVIEIENQHIYYRVHPEVDRYFCEGLLDKGREFSGGEHKICKEKFGSKYPFRIQTRLAEGETLNIGGYRVWKEGGYVKTDRSKVFAEITGHRYASSTPCIEGECYLDIFVDSNLIEVFVNRGQYVISNVVYGLSDLLEGYVEQIYIPQE